MTHRNPKDRDRGRTEKGEQPYKDAREALAENEAELKSEAEELWRPGEQESDEVRLERLKAEAEDRLKEVQREIAGP